MAAKNLSDFAKALEAAWKSRRPTELLRTDRESSQYQMKPLPRYCLLKKKREDEHPQEVTEK
jgi:hypothetical protein